MPLVTGLPRSATKETSPTLTEDHHRWDRLEEVFLTLPPPQRSPFTQEDPMRSPSPPGSPGSAANMGTTTGLALTLTGEEEPSVAFQVVLAWIAREHARVLQETDYARREMRRLGLDMPSVPLAKPGTGLKAAVVNTGASVNTLSSKLDDSVPVKPNRGRRQSFMARRSLTSFGRPSSHSFESDSNFVPSSSVLSRRPKEEDKTAIDDSTLWPANLGPRLKETTAAKWRPPSVAVGCTVQESSFRPSLAHAYTGRAGSNGYTPSLTQNFVFHPNSSMMMGLDILGMAMVVCELFITPFVWAWDVAIEGGVYALSWVMAIYWLIDFVLHFNTAVYIQGRISTSRTSIFWKYLMGWLVPDLALLACDFFSLAMVASGPLDSSKSDMLRLTKAFRCLKVLRITRLFRFVDKAMQWCLSFTVRFALQLSTIVFITLLFNHILCCIWWAVGLADQFTDTGSTWATPIQEQAFGVVYEYTTALHWTTAQMTLGSTDVIATNSLERCFSVFLLFAALLLGSSLISFVSAQIMHLIMLKQDKTQKITDVRRYLQQEAVPTRLSADVQRQVAERVEKVIPIAEEDVTILNALSKSLRNELTYATRVPFILRHPLFRVWGRMDMRPVKDLCNKAVIPVILPDDDDLFLPGELAEYSYFIRDGAVDYVQSPSSSMVEKEITLPVTAPRWICEVALWVDWKHVGRLTAKGVCRVFALDVEKVAALVAKTPVIEELTRTYAKNYFQRVVVSMPPHSSWPNDIHVPYTDPADLMTSDHEITLLKFARDHGALVLTDAQHKDLLQELQDEKCCLQTGEDGELIRVVQLIAWRIQDAQKRVLYKVGVADQACVKPALVLPGGKRKRAELPQQAMGRVLREELPVLADHVVRQHIEHEVERKASQRYDIDTTYFRTVQVATYTGNPGRLLQAFVNKSKFTEMGRQELGLLTSREVYMVPEDPIIVSGNPGRADRVNLYAFLAPEEILWLSQTEKKEYLNEWLNAVEVWVVLPPLEQTEV